jgi:hypothetical protein
VSEQLPHRPDDGHPVLAGLAALIGVAVAVGLVLGVVVMAGTRVLGLGEDSDTGRSTGKASLYVPRPEKTPTDSSPQITLAPGESPSATRTARPTESPSPRHQITLSASATSVAAMQQLDLTGVYPGGEGAILQVQRFTDGRWQDFPVTASVGDETFATYVQTSQPGMNRFRVVDTDTGLESNEVRVTIG